MLAHIRPEKHETPSVTLSTKCGKSDRQSRVCSPQLSLTQLGNKNIHREADVCQISQFLKLCSENASDSLLFG